MRIKYYNLWALLGVVIILALLFSAGAKATSIHWEYINTTGSERLVVIDKAGVITYKDLETVCKALPLKSYGYAVTVHGSVICLEARQESDWELIKDYIEDQFGD